LLLVTRTRHALHEHEKGETGFNKDAEAIGGAALDGADSLAEKAKRKMYGI
jgi:hypothetical protein